MLLEFYGLFICVSVLCVCVCVCVFNLLGVIILGWGILVVMMLGIVVVVYFLFKGLRSYSNSRRMYYQFTKM